MTAQKIEWQQTGKGDWRAEVDGAVLLVSRTKKYRKTTRRVANSWVGHKSVFRETITFVEARRTPGRAARAAPTRTATRPRFP